MLVKEACAIQSGVIQRISESRQSEHEEILDGNKFNPAVFVSVILLCDCNLK